MYIPKKCQFTVVMLAMFSLSTVFPNLASAADADYEFLSQVSENKCINILVDTGIDTGQQKFFYNGHIIDVPTDYIAIKDVQIGGDRVGFIAWKGDGKGEVLVDNQVVGSVVDWPAYNPDLDDLTVANADYQLKINNKHVAYLRMVDLLKFHVIFDNHDFGEIPTGEKIKLNGDYVIFRKYIKGQYHIFVNNKDIGVGNYGDFDGKNVVLVKENNNLYFNGKKITNVGSWGNVDLFHGILAYDKGPISSPSVVYKGRNLGKGVFPKIESKNIAFLKGLSKPSLVYNNKVFKNVWDDTKGFDNSSFSLAGNHFAFFQKYNDVGVLNIDGKAYDQAVGERTMIAKKENCKTP